MWYEKPTSADVEAYYELKINIAYFALFIVTYALTTVMIEHKVANELSKYVNSPENARISCDPCLLAMVHWFACNTKSRCFRRAHYF